MADERMSKDVGVLPLPTSKPGQIEPVYDEANRGRRTAPRNGVIVEASGPKPVMKGEQL